MSLRDLIRKGSSASAIANSAIGANDRAVLPSTLAKIAVANFAAVPSVSTTNAPASAGIEALQQFSFDLIESEIAAGHSAAELNRVNDIAWNFMQHDGLPFEVAIHIAADIVVHCDPAPCEAVYESAMNLWKQGKSST